MNEFLGLMEDLLKYVNTDNIDNFVALLENLVRIAEDVKEAADKASKGK